MGKGTKTSEAANPEMNVQRLQKHFKRRFDRHRIYAISILIVMVLSLGIGTYLFWESGRLHVTSIEESIQSYAENIDFLNDNSRLNQERVEAIEHNLESLVYLVDSSKNIDIGMRAESKIVNTAQSLNDALLETSQNFHTQADSLKKIVQANSLQRLRLTEYDRFSNLVFRIGIVLLSIFIVQVLFRIYKYNTRLAAYYLGLVKALEFSEPETLPKFKEMVEIFSAKHLDLQASPESPLVELLQKAVQGS